MNGPDTRLEAAEIIKRLGLVPHPEGGHYRETFRDPRCDSAGRSLSTAIFFLLCEGELSRWHRIDTVEVWHWYSGAPLELSMSAGFGEIRKAVLGNDISAGQSPQAVVPTAMWQQARSLGDWTLLGCTVAPGFDFAAFELAGEGFAP